MKGALQGLTIAPATEAKRLLYGVWGGPLGQSLRANEDLNYLGGVDKAGQKPAHDRFGNGHGRSWYSWTSFCFYLAYEAKRKIISWMATRSAGSGFVLAGPKLSAASKCSR